ncbi:MAG TPA: hypothetical protein VFT22_35660 [Kofleriaceae bacterium]|nr:hypothetical protein [Kofleriaceae bacterium]
MTCPGELELARAIGEGGDAEIAAHLAACDDCRAIWDRTRAMIELARELPAPLPPAPRREEVRTAVLAAAASVTRRPARRAWLVPVAAGAAAAGVVGYLAVHPATPYPAPMGAGSAEPLRQSGRGVVHPQPGARYEISAPGPDEIVRLFDGVVEVEVEPLVAGERFRVIVGGSEIEVRGTVFTVTASAEHLVGVEVSRGRVEVRPETGAPAAVVAGQAWRLARAPVAEPAASAPPRSPSAPGPAPAPHRAAPGPSRRPTPALARSATAPAHDSRPQAPVPVSPQIPVQVSPQVPVQVSLSASSDPVPGQPVADAARAPDELAYDQAWAALRASEFARAASGFARVVLIAPEGALVEDASYWRAVALARGQRSAEAVAAFRDFLEAFGGSAHAGQASAMLGWLLIDTRAYREAERWFRAAAGDPSPGVRKSAQAGLDALARRTR